MNKRKKAVGLHYCSKFRALREERSGGIPTQVPRHYLGMNISRAAVTVTTQDVSTRVPDLSKGLPSSFMFAPRGTPHKTRSDMWRDRRKAKKLTKKYLAPVSGLVDTRGITRAGRNRTYLHILHGSYTDEMLKANAILKKDLARQR